MGASSRTLCDARQGFGVFRDGFRDGAVVDALASAAAFDEAGVGENLKMVGNGGGANPSDSDDVTADHALICGNGLKDQEARGVRQSL